MTLTWRRLTQIKVRHHHHNSSLEFPVFSPTTRWRHCFMFKDLVLQAQLPHTQFYFILKAGFQSSRKL